MRPIMAACSAFEVTLYVSKDLEMNSAATLAVAHSSLYSAPSHDFDPGAMARIWASVMVFLVAVFVLAVFVLAVSVVDAAELDAAGAAELQPALASAKK